MKIYYSTLDKEKKRKIKEIYKKDYASSDVDIRLKRLTIYSLFGYLFAILIILYTIIKTEDVIGNLIIAITLFIASTVFLVGRILIKRNVLNKIALKNK